jgi:hypothetical protein
MKVDKDQADAPVNKMMQSPPQPKRGILRVPIRM